MPLKPNPHDRGLHAPQLLRDLREVYKGGESAGGGSAKKKAAPKKRLIPLEKMKKDDPAAFIRMLNDNEQEWHKQRVQLLSIKGNKEEETPDKDECLAIAEKLINDYMKEHPEAK